MDANRLISMRDYVLWRAIVNCDVCSMCSYCVSISEGECDRCDAHLRVFSRSHDKIVPALGDPCWQGTYHQVWDVPLWVGIRWDGELSSLIDVHSTLRGGYRSCEKWRRIRDVQLELKGCASRVWAWRLNGNWDQSYKIEVVEGRRYFYIWLGVGNCWW